MTAGEDLAHDMLVLALAREREHGRPGGLEDVLGRLGKRPEGQPGAFGLRADLGRPGHEHVVPRMDAGPRERHERVEVARAAGGCE